LQILQQLKTIPLYISYFLKVVDRHSLQAPYIYNFYSTLINNLGSSKLDPQIEEVREELKKNKHEVKGEDFGAGSRVARVSGRRKISSIARFGISSGKDCLLLSELVSRTKGKVIIELGTSLGLSTAYLSRAVPDGVIYTFEGNSHLCEIALNNWKKLACQNIRLIQGDISTHLKDVLSQVGEVDFAIIDANHTKDAVIEYFEMICPKMADRGMILIDDIRWSTEMYEAWRLLVKDARVPVSIEFLGRGLLIFENGMAKQHYVLSY